MRDVIVNKTETISALRIVLAGAGRRATSARNASLTMRFADPLLPVPVPRGILHDVIASHADDRGPASAFALALVAGAGDLLWVQQGAAAAEGGRPYGPGLAALGFDPGRLLLLRVRKAEEALWAAEEGLACAALAAVLVEIDGTSRALTSTALRRLKLRAAAGGVTGLLLRYGTRATTGPPLPVDLRWQIAAAPSGGQARHLLGPPAATVDLLRNRFGRTGRLDLVWDLDHDALHPAARARPPLSEPADRTAGAARSA